jgi:hypothetical protein
LLFALLSFRKYFRRAATSTEQLSARAVEIFES